MLSLTAMIRKASILGSVALLLLSACAEEETSGIATARSQMKPLVDAACDWMFGCCSPDELVYQVGDFTVDANDCSARMLDAIEAGVPLELEQGGLSDDPAAGLLILALSINEDRVDVNGGAVRECANSTSGMACNAPLVIDSGTGRCTPSAAEPEDPCDPNEMFVGKQSVGEQCDGLSECKEGLRCIDFGIAGVCALRAKQGETCFSDEECAEDLVCDWESGTCTPGALSGEACAFADPLDPVPGTETIRCAAGLTCDAATSICTGGFCAPGSPCGDIFDDTDCPDSYFCVDNSFTQATCQQPGGEGSPCFKPEDCQSNFCDPFEEVCANLLGVGESCFGNDECASGFCDGGLCSPSVSAGQPCPSFDNAECDGGYCDTTDPAGPTCRAYVGQGGACPTGVECDPSLDLSCVDAMCLQEPFPNGTTCFDGSQCASRACYMGECTAGAVVGAACRTDGSTEPCIVGSFCDAPQGALDGTCADLRRPGQACTDDGQCWGSCITRFGSRMCDATPALALDEVWCDGQ